MIIGAPPRNSYQRRNTAFFFKSSGTIGGNFIHFLEKYDQVANTGTGARISRIASPPRLRLRANRCHESADTRMTTTAEVAPISMKPPTATPSRVG
ncbi:hypothetical protein J2X71_006536 [Rhizobium sp. 1399]|nr:hypothetical protein [Rhizobium sp. 1399]